MRSTAPVPASTSTVSRLGPRAPVPFSVVSQASAAAVPVATTTSRVSSTPVTVASRRLATAIASSALSEGAADSVPIGRLCATEVYVVRPAASTATTKSPPITGRPL